MLVHFKYWVGAGWDLPGVVHAPVGQGVGHGHQLGCGVFVLRQQHLLSDLVVSWVLWRFLQSVLLVPTGLTDLEVVKGVLPARHACLGCQQVDIVRLDQLVIINCLVLEMGQTLGVSDALGPKMGLPHAVVVVYRFPITVVPIGRPSQASLVVVALRLLYAFLVLGVPRIVAFCQGATAVVIQILLTLDLP